MLDKLINSYVERFGKNFPMFCLIGASDSEVTAIIEQCLKDNKPYDTSDIDPLEALY